MSLLKKEITPEQAKDSGLALVLIALILALWGPTKYFLPLGMVLLVLVMTAPAMFGPFAKLWLGVSHVVGSLVSRVLLTVLFYVLVTPVGLLRRMMGKDAMQLRSWKQGTRSVFRERNQLFAPEDLDHPY
jgi:multisubunit Na+/H+ antiporter MnhG subunit